jgi:hypothetical protein
MSLNHNPPKDVKSILDDPIEDASPYVTKVECLTMHMKIEHRLTKLESMNAITMLTTAATLIGIILALWKLFW